MLTTTLVGVWPQEAGPAATDGGPEALLLADMPPPPSLEAAAAAATRRSYSARLASLHGGPNWSAPHALFLGVFPARDGAGAFAAEPRGAGGEPPLLLGYYQYSVQAALAYDRWVRAHAGGAAGPLPLNFAAPATPTPVPGVSLQAAEPWVQVRFCGGRGGVGGAPWP